MYSIKDESVLRLEICDIGKRVYARGMGAANDGNISVRIGDVILTTPSGVSKGFMTPEILCKVDLEGNLIEDSNNGYKPSSEIKIHLEVYKQRSDIQAVVHAHPLYATAYAVCHQPLTKQILPEATMIFGEVPVAKYGTPSTSELPESLVQYLDTHDVILMENHGAISYGNNLFSAYSKMEALEYYANMHYLLYGIDKPVELTNENVARLVDLRQTYFKLPGKHPFVK